MSKKVQEELIDTHLGWDLLVKQYSQDDFSTSHRLIDYVEKNFSFSPEESEFIKEIKQKECLTGPNSNVHSYELAELGKIVRTKL